MRVSAPLGAVSQPQMTRARPRPPPKTIIIIKPFGENKKCAKAAFRAP